MITDLERGYLRMLGLRIRVLRTARRLSQDRLAEAAGVSRVTLGSIERGEHPAVLVTYVRLAAALDLRLPDLVDPDATDHDVLQLLGNRQA